MKKIISVFILLCLVFGSAPITLFANTTKQDELQKEGQTEYTDTAFSQCESMTDSLQDLELIEPVTETQIHQYHFDESSKSFLEQITAETLDLQGYIAVSSGQKTIPLNRFFAETTASRFDILEIAHQNDVITEEEKIEAYCTLLEEKIGNKMRCLHGVMTTLHRYALSDSPSQTLVNRIDAIFPIPRSSNDISTSEDPATFEEELASLHFPETYSSTHFLIYYATSAEDYPEGFEMITEEDAAEVATFFETVYTSFNHMGFRTPLLDEGETKFPVVLDPGPNFWGIAKNLPVTVYENTCSMSIVLYEYQSLTNFVKENIAHEYFHAIECAYHWLFLPTNISEAFANWATVAGTGTSTSLDSIINWYLESSLPMDQDPTGGNGLLLYPLTIQKECGPDAIVAILEEMEQSERTTVNFSQFGGEIVNPALSPWSETFNTIFLKMAANNYKPETFYASIHPGGASAVSSWQGRITSTTTTTPTSRATTLQNAVQNETINAYSNNYHVFTPNSAGKTAKITVKIVFSGTDAIYGIAQCLYKTASGTYVLETIPKTATHTYTFTYDGYGAATDFCIITSTFGGSGATYSISYRVEQGTSTNLSLPSVHRYAESVATLEKGEYRDFNVSFAVGGTKLIQTFGTNDTYMILYNANGTQLTYNDDGGYSYNSLISYSFTANTQYRIRVMFYSSTVTGKVKLAITPSSSSYSSYEALTATVDTTSIISGYLYQNSVNYYTYKYSTTRNITVNVASDVNVYLYIIDPRSTELVRAANNTTPSSTLASPCLRNDDYLTTTQSQITKTFDAGVPYLIIVSMHNPTTNGGNQYYMRVSAYE